MEATEEGFAAAAAIREAAKRKRVESAAADDASAKRNSKPVKNCTHEVRTPESYQPPDPPLDSDVYGTLEHPAYKGAPAKTYPFTLDPFQQMGVACLERRESVLVSAHTSAGKTVVAEYAIAMAFRDKQKVLYTSPLKALSNQKYRDLADEFTGDVGLMTGDVSINPNATCLVMTTEILRSMIYRGSEMLREVAWVIFDEVHYMKDRERGVVWEETIIFLPSQVRMVFLSATLPNAVEFADWIGHLHKQPCHVVYTDYRPTPLQHYGFPIGGTGLYLIVDEKGKFREENFSKLTSSFKDKDSGGGKEDPQGAANGGRGRGEKDSGRGRGGRGRGGPGGGRGGGKQKQEDMAQNCVSMLRLIQKLKMHPVIFFCFNRREVENYAMRMMKMPDFTDDAEKEAIKQVFDNALSILNEEDRQLDAIQNIFPLLLKGIAMHHAGLLPLLKELIEILFQEGLIKALFATETFAMGLNMPARTVVFTAIKKWDGQESRLMESGEYIQMSGRAGRRGKDDRGVCIIMLEEALEEQQCRNLIMGKSMPLKSSFKLSYYTLLNLLRRMEGTVFNMEYVIQNSFQQYQQERNLPQLESELQRIKADMETLGEEGEKALEEFVNLRRQIDEQEQRLLKVVTQPQHCVHFLRPGRLIYVNDGTNDWGWGVVVCVTRSGQKNGTANGSELDAAANYHVDTLLACQGSSLSAGRPKPAKPGDPDAEMVVVPVMLPLLRSFSALRITIPEDLTQRDARKAVLVNLQQLLSKHPAGLPKLDPLDDMNIADEELHDAVHHIQELEDKLAKNPVFQAEKDQEKFAVFEKKALLAERATVIKQQMKHSQLAEFRAEAKARTNVLRALGCLDQDNIVTLKGRAACEIDTADELLTTELMFNGTFNKLDKHQLVALVSCLIPVDKSNETIQVARMLADPLTMLQQTARRIADLSRENKLEVDSEKYVESFRPFLMDVIYQWSKGVPFGDICKMTDIFEGSIIRAMRRLDELMQQLSRAARVMGDDGLADHLEASNETLRRDIVFAASLYL